MKKISGGLLFRLSLIVFSIIIITICVIVFICSVFIKHYIRLAENIDFMGIRISTMTLIITVISTVLIISMLISLFLLRLYLKPINELKEAMIEVSKGKFELLEEQSETKEINDLIVSYNKMVKELAHMTTLHEDYTANISHEFKTPLATIKGYIDLLSMDDITDDEKVEYLNIIKIANERLIGLTNNILLLNKLDNKEILEVSSFSLDDQIRDSLILLEEKWTKKNINMNISLDEFIIESNKELLSSVWINLINNAIKFTHDDGNITVELKANENEAIVKVIDDGIGINEKEYEHIFERFYQIDKSHKLEGNGLGLALVKRIIDKIKGKIVVRSVEGEGTEFIVTINKKSY